MFIRVPYSALSISTSTRQISSSWSGRRVWTFTRTRMTSRFTVIPLRPSFPFFSPGFLTASNQSGNGWEAIGSDWIQPRRSSSGVGSSNCLGKFESTDPILVSGELVAPATKVRDLGVIIDSELTFIPHVDSVVKLCFFHLRQLRLIRRSLTIDTTRALVRALVHSRLDYCNGVLADLPINQVNYNFLPRWALVGCLPQGNKINLCMVPLYKS